MDLARGEEGCGYGCRCCDGKAAEGEIEAVTGATMIVASGTVSSISRLLTNTHFGAGHSHYVICEAKS